MKLLEEDDAYLNERGYTFELVPDGSGGCLIIKTYPLALGKYDRQSVDLMICIPPDYNDAKLDMYYVDPEIRLAATGQHPEQASHFENHANRRWQRFSRHLPQWRPGIDTLRNYFPLINRELQNLG